MKTSFLALGFIGALLSVTVAHADTVYTITNGVLTTYQGTTVVGSYSGTFTLNTFFTLQSGSFSATVNGTTYTALNQIVGNNPTTGYAAFFDSAGDHFNFQLTGTQIAPVLCTVALCGSGDILLDPFAGGNFSAKRRDADFWGSRSHDSGALVFHPLQYGTARNSCGRPPSYQPRLKQAIWFTREMGTNYHFLGVHRALVLASATGLETGTQPEFTALVRSIAMARREGGDSSRYRGRHH